MKSIVLLFFFGLISTPSFAGFDDKEKPHTRFVSAKVVADNGEALPGAAITIIETGESLFADLDGNFNIALPVDKVYTIEISTIGYEVARVNSKNILPFSQQVLAALP